MMRYSIVTINLNNKNGLCKTIESIITQTCQDFEYIIIDGGSTDGSVDVIREYEDRITYWVSEPDKGIYNAMNKGILHAQGEYLNFMNSGDCFFENNILERALPYLDSDIVAGKVMFRTSIWGQPREEITMLDLLKSPLPHQASFFRRMLFEDRLYDEKYKIVSDWKFCVEKLIFENVTYHNLDFVICDYNPEGISSTNTIETMMERQKVLREFFPERVLQDYFRWVKVDSPLCELAPMFNRTYRFQKMIYSTVRCMIQVREFFLRIKHLNLLT